MADSSFTVNYWLRKFEEAEHEILPENYRYMKMYMHQKKHGCKVKERSLTHYYQTLIPFAKWCKKPFSTLTEWDIYDYCDFLERKGYELNGKKKKYSEASLFAYKASIKTLLKDINHDAVAHIELKKVKKVLNDLLEKEDIAAMINAGNHPRDKAIISFLYESGCRKGELLNMLIEDIKLDEYGAVAQLNGKTGNRKCRVFTSAPYLRQWLEVHPTKNNKKSSLFCSLREPYSRLSQTGIQEQIGRIARRAGIDKPVNCHHFRHSRATHLANVLSDQNLKNYLGWTAGSSMAATYVHIKNTDDAILKMYGIVKDGAIADPLKVGKCPRCGDLNQETAHFCSKCAVS